MTNDNKAITISVCAVVIMIIGFAWAATWSTAHEADSKACIAEAQAAHHVTTEQPNRRSLPMRELEFNDGHIERSFYANVKDAMPTQKQQNNPAIRRMTVQRIGRNEPCPCGSGKKFKKCCIGKAQERKEPTNGE